MNEQKILVEVTLGKTVNAKDTPEEAAFRKDLAKEVKEMKAKGITIEIPNEWPGPSASEG